MKHIALTLCLAGAVVGLSACMSTSYDSGASYASGRTAGNVDYGSREIDEPAYSSDASTESSFKSQMSK
jgi:hypothetical protein